MYGGVHAYAVTEQKDTANDRNFLVLGPWRHSGVNYDGTTLGPLHLEGNTALQFRRDIMQPFLDEHLKDGAPKANTPPVFVYETGTNAWRRLPAWPLSCESGCASTPRRLYLQPGFQLAFSAPAAGAAAFDEYVSDPAKPVPYQPRPVHFADNTRLAALAGERSALRRRPPDVLSYVTAPLTAPLHIGGAPAGEPVRLHQRHRQRLGGEAHRRLPGRGALGPAHVRLPAGRSAWISSAGVTARASSIRARWPANKVQAYHFALPHGGSRVPARSPPHGADPVELVPAL